jgi:fermentation-respiration switch protein FrsA (DUF1100 family)
MTSMPARLALAALLLLVGCARLRPGAAGVAPGQPSGARFAVGVRHAALVDQTRPTVQRSGATTAGRALPTTIWYPAAGAPGGSAIPDAQPAPGPFPVVLFSHGLRGVPEDYRALVTRWAGAGFVVAAPAYPLTHRGAAEVVPGDLRNQPADASFVLTAVLGLGAERGDPLGGRLDAGRVGAAGHSEGALTTVGLFNACRRDARLKAGVVLAGDLVGFGPEFAGPAAPLLFVHGVRDRVVPYALGRRAFEADPWPKALLTLAGAGHLEPYLRPGDPGFELVAGATTDFLRWSLAGDQAALAALRARAAAGAALDDRLGQGSPP